MLAGFQIVRMLSDVEHCGLCAWGDLSGRQSLFAIVKCKKEVNFACNAEVKFIDRGTVISGRDRRSGSRASTAQERESA
jgi:hypothetical protein